MADRVGKVCFVVSQIGDEESPERVHADWVFDGILDPLFKEKFPHYELIRADKIAVPGQIDAQVIDLIIKSDLVIADITNTNPNVFYEIGIRHVIRKPIIHINLKGQTIPFDIKLFRSMQFLIDRPANLRRAQSELAELVAATEVANFEVDNPVVRANTKAEFEHKATKRERYLEEMIDQLSARVASIESRRTSINSSEQRFEQQEYSDSFYELSSKNNTAIERNEFSKLKNLLVTHYPNIIEDVIYSDGKITISMRDRVLRREISELREFLESNSIDYDWF